MPDMHPGGPVDGPPIKVTLDDAECIVTRDGECRRTDAVHEAYHTIDRADTSRKGSST